MRNVEIYEIGIPAVSIQIVGWPLSKEQKPVPPAPGEWTYLLLDDGSRVLTEDGSAVLIETN